MKEMKKEVEAKKVMPKADEPRVDANGVVEAKEISDRRQVREAKAKENQKMADATKSTHFGQ